MVPRSHRDTKRMRKSLDKLNCNNPYRTADCRQLQSNHAFRPGEKEDPPAMMLPTPVARPMSAAPVANKTSPISSAFLRPAQPTKLHYG